jgi:hypothetical protein
MYPNKVNTRCVSFRKHNDIKTLKAFHTNTGTLEQLTSRLNKRPDIVALVVNKVMEGIVEVIRGRIEYLVIEGDTWKNPKYCESLLSIPRVVSMTLDSQIIKQMGSYPNIEELHLNLTTKYTECSAMEECFPNLVHLAIQTDQDVAIVSTNKFKTITSLDLNATSQVIHLEDLLEHRPLEQISIRCTRFVVGGCLDGIKLLNVSTSIRIRDDEYKDLLTMATKIPDCCYHVISHYNSMIPQYEGDEEIVSCVDYGSDLISRRFKKQIKENKINKSLVSLL